MNVDEEASFGWLNELPGRERGGKWGAPLDRGPGMTVGERGVPQ